MDKSARFSMLLFFRLLEPNKQILVLEMHF